MSFLLSLFSSKETKKLIGVLDEIGTEIIEKNIKNNDAPSIAIAWSSTSQVLKKTLSKNSKGLSKKIKEERIEPSFVIYNMIYKYTRGALASGRNHIYRGVLSSIGNGYLIINKFVLLRLKQMKVYTDEEVKDLIDEVNEDIRSMG